MKFVNRQKELEILSKNYDIGKISTIIIYGLRRIGKTRLVQEFIKDKPNLYFFVNKQKTSEKLLQEFSEQLNLKSYERIKTWDEFFEVLFERYENYVVVFDEFQNFVYIEPSIFGVIQKTIDLNENKNITLIFLGSLVGLMKKIFYDQKEPLFGRINLKIKLKELEFKHVVEMCKHKGINKFEDILKLYFIFGGFPRCYVLIKEKDFKSIINEMFLEEYAILENEVLDILALEFGRRSKIYYEILCAIANGCNTLKEISNYLSVKETSLTRPLNELQNYFELVEKRDFWNKKLYFIKHPLINFWFYMFYKNYSLYVKRDKKFIENFWEKLNQYFGFRFEELCKKLLAKKFEYVSGFYLNRKKIGTIDIDIVAYDDSKLIFGECKWKDNINAEKICKELIEKIQYVNIPKELENHKKELWIFAKSFKNKIDQYEDYSVKCFDLNDLKNLSIL